MNIARAFVAMGCGTVFGLGLIISGMSNPEKVLGFLDILGPWDPSLAVVMAAAVLVGTGGFRYAAAKPKPVLDHVMHLPSAAAIDRRLLAGSAIFGIGWGLAGYCPGPVIASLALGMREPWIFLAGMLAGMAIFEIAFRSGYLQGK